MRLIGLLVLAFVIYLFLKSVFGLMVLYRKKQEVERQINEREGGAMAEDPICHTYIPKATAFQKKIAGEILYFCGKECAEAFAKK